MGQAPGDRCGARRSRRRRDARRRRNRRRDVVAVRRAGRARTRSIPHFSENIRRHVDKVLRNDPFHVSANTDPKGDRSKPPQEQDPDMLLHVVKETDAGIVVRGAKFETAAAYANQAFTKPTIANWGNERAVGLRRGLHLRPRLAEPEVHLPHRLRRPRAERGLSARQPLRRGRYAGHLRRRADPLGERPVLPPHQGGDLHPLDAASLFGALPSSSAT